MKRLLLTFAFVLMASQAFATCVEHAVLHDTDYFGARYRWSNGRVDIKMWDSPSMIRLVGTLVPGAHVTVLDRRENFIKVRARDEHGGTVGWISFALVEMTFQQSVDDIGPECATAVAVENEPEKAVQSARERKAEGKSLQASTLEKRVVKAVD